MVPSARIAALIDALHELDDNPKPADSILSAQFRARRYIGSKDRAFIAESYYRVLRHYARYTWWCDFFDLKVGPRSFAILDIHFFSGYPVENHFDDSRYSAPALTDQEYEVIEKLKKYNDINHPDMPEEVRYECPDWAYTKLKEIFKDDFKEQMENMLEAADLHLRINTIKAPVEVAMKELRREDIEIKKGELSPYALIVQGRPGLSQTKAFKDGLVEIQDQGSQLIALLCEPKAGQQVIDFCAGAGGKTLALGAMMNNKGRIVACDVLEGRLKRAAERFRRAGLHNIETRPLASENDKWVKRNKGKFDVVLADAPCSGTGTWKRNPDMKWRYLGPGLEELTKLQASILDSACRLVKSGGRLVYGTCSLLPEENSQQIEAFLKRHPEFELVPVKDIWDRAIGTPNPGLTDYMRLTPAQSNTDGFFAAVLIKKSESPAEEAALEA